MIIYILECFYIPCSLATRRRRVQLTAMARIPPFFLVSAVIDAPKKHGLTTLGVSLARSRLEKFIKARVRRTPPSTALVPVRLRRCWGRRKSGPPAEPLGNVLIVLMRSSLLTVRVLLT